MGYYCPYCGNYLNDSDKVCTSCGRQLDIQPQQVQPAQQPEWNNQQQPGWNNQQQSVPQARWNNQQQSVPQARWNNQQSAPQAGWNNQSQQYAQRPQQTVQQPVQNPISQSVQHTMSQPVQRPMSQSVQPSQKPEPTMKWFKFVIWLQLFISAIVAAVNATLLLTGYNYGDMTKLIGSDFSSALHEYLENAVQMKELVYAYYPSLQMVDFGCGIAYAVVALLAIIVRFRLSGMKKNGPSLYIFYLVVEVLVSVAYMGLVIHAIQSLTIDASFIASMASIGWSVILILLNMTYFKKRKHMFCK